jgi:hypothetical protein
MSDPDSSAPPPAPRRSWLRRLLKWGAFGCGATLALFLALIVALFVLLDRVPKSYPPAAHPVEPPTVEEYVRYELDGFASPYLGHTGSWDGKGGAMFGASKAPDLDWEVGMGLRWTFTPAHWSALEPDGPVDLAQAVPPAWRALDGYVVAAQKRRINVLMQVVIGGNAGGPPKWAGRREPGKSAPEDMAAAAAFAGKLAARYRPGGALARAQGWDHYGVRAWELDNEPNVYLTHWGGQAGDYAEFVTLAGARIKKEDERAMLLLPATTGGGDAAAWVRAALGLSGADGSPVYRQRGERYSIGPVADGVSFHNYEGADSVFASEPRTVERVFSEIQDAFEAGESVDHYARKRAFWHTEGNFDFIGALSAERRAAWRVQHFTRAFAAGVRKVCVMDASKRDHAAVKAYVEVLPWPFPMRPADADVKVVEGRATVFRHDAGAGSDAGVVWVVWAVSGAGDARVDLPALRERVTVVRLDGTKAALPATGGRVVIDLKGDKKMAPPVLVVDRSGELRQRPLRGPF